MNINMNKKGNRTWVVFANEAICNHRLAIKETCILSWTMNQRANFEVGDTVYLYMSDTESVNFKMKVTAKDVNREDGKYWTKSAPKDKTYRLELVQEYNGDLLHLNDLARFGIKSGSNFETPNVNNKELIGYIEGVFQNAIALPRRFMVIDLYSGSYTSSKTGHEVHNLIPNKIDGRYYGYCPPHDDTNIAKLGASKDDEYIEDVMVIYVQKSLESNDREVIAFTDKAKVFRHPQDGKRLNRFIMEGAKKVYLSYTIESEYIYDLRSVANPFVIRIHEYNVQMFRKQRFYNGKYPKLDNELIAYLTNYLKNRSEQEDDDSDYQKEIQESESHGKARLKETYNKEPSYSNSSNGKSVNKNPRIAKQSLESAEYKCTFDSLHETFLTNKGVPYMEGHHLIPCTASNAERFWNIYQRNIDCEENIVCLCPTCHRRIHFGSIEEKKTIIEKLYNKQKEKLQLAGLKLSLEELYGLYKVVSDGKLR